VRLSLFQSSVGVTEAKKISESKFLDQLDPQNAFALFKGYHLQH
jgi:hypothetical protein